MAYNALTISFPDIVLLAIISTLNWRWCIDMHCLSNQYRYTIDIDIDIGKYPRRSSKQTFDFVFVVCDLDLLLLLLF